MMKGYVVKFKDGFYAKNQPHYNWSFTDDVKKAMIYKSIRNARKRAEYPSSYGRGAIDIVETEMIDYSDLKLIGNVGEVKKATIEDEKKRLTKRFMKQCIADGDNWDEVLESRLKKFKAKM
jgi:hypothetical protein